jgi:hypothetical protein
MQLRLGARRQRAFVFLVGVAALVVTAACSGNLLSRKYEYEEDIYLALDGSATVYVNASIPALVALRGFPLNVDPRARLDRTAVRALFESPSTHVESVTASRRDNRRYVHLRLDVPDVAQLGQVAPFAWAQYGVNRDETVVRYRQILSAAASHDVGNVGWSGRELVAIRLHLPSRVIFHNSPTHTVERGNIIVWEQTLNDRLRGQPLDIEAHMETQSILARTLILFGLMIVLAAATFAVLIWLVRRRGRAMRGAQEQEAS